MECGGQPQISRSQVTQLTAFFQNLFDNPSLMDNQTSKIQLLSAVNSLVLSVSTTATNIFGLVVLYQRQMRREHSTFRELLVMLTISNIFNGVAFVNFDLWQITLGTLAIKMKLNSGYAVVMALCFCFTWTAVGVRNWLVAAISVARCEAICRPLSPKVVTTFRLKAFAVLILALTLFLCLLFGFSSSWNVYCVIPDAQNLSGNTTNSSINSNATKTERSSWTKARHAFLLMYLRGLAVGVVIITSGIILLKLRYRPLNSSQGRPHITAATRTLIAITTLFTFFEGFVLVLIIAQLLSSKWSPTVLAIFEIFIVSFTHLYSIADIIVFIYLNEQFRQVTVRLCYCSKISPLRPS